MKLKATNNRCGVLQDAEVKIVDEEASKGNNRGNKIIKDENIKANKLKSVEKKEKRLMQRRQNAIRKLESRNRTA